MAESRAAAAAAAWPVRLLAAWALLTAAGSWVVYQQAHVEAAPMPSAEAGRWALSALAAARGGQSLPPAPRDATRYRTPGPVIVQAWFEGAVRASHVGRSDFASSVRDAAAAFARDDGLRALPGWPAAASKPVRFTLTVVRGTAPLVGWAPLLSNLSIVPGVEGALAEFHGRRAYLTPDELLAGGLFDHVKTPIPDLSFGVDLPAVQARLAAQLGVPRAQLLREGALRRFRAGTISADPYPKPVPVRPATLEHAAGEGAAFLLRHQKRDGRYTYLYHGQTGAEAEDAGYNLPRHAGTTYFLAHAGRVLQMPEARAGALRALRWVSSERLTHCGGLQRWCVRSEDGVDMGSSALTALAAAELLRGGDDPSTRALLVGLTRFIRSMQRPDGELMHVYDLEADRPIDVQRMYYSGEAADALLASYEVLGDARDLYAALRVMRHLTGAGWNFFGSRYFYGEEHWTCQAVARAAALGTRAGADVALGIDFCERWLAFQRALQYPRNQTPWQVEGAIGVGPLLVPRLTSMASRTEAAAMLYPVLRAEGTAVASMRAQVEAGLGLLLRMRWGPGPTHLLFDPAAALGGVPGSFMSLDVRNDYVQHASSAMLHWIEALRGEAPTRPPG